MKPKRVDPSDAAFCRLFPSARGRKAGDEAIDKLSVRADMRAFVDAWEAAYFEVTGTSPFRGVEDG